MTTSDYVDSSTQTEISGLAKHPTPVPPVFFHTSATPPEDMPAKELQLNQLPSKPSANNPNSAPSLLLRRINRPPMIARISLPETNLDEDDPNSPPPTQAVLSPLPAANRLHAGHTPIFPRSLSPLNLKDRSGESSPEREQALSGPLTLPPQPGDGAGEHIELKVLDAELEKIAKGQGSGERQSEAVSILDKTVEHREDGEQLSRKASAEARRRSSTGEIETVDGVHLKKPKMNMGAPLGQA